jgi:hypothetical protein
MARRDPMAELHAMIAARNLPKVAVKPKTIQLDESEIIPRLELGRCERVRNSIHPQTYKRIWLQCVEDPGHSGACMYENPTNRKKR